MTAQVNAPSIPDSAPFSQEQIAWLNGFLAGMYSSVGETGGAAARVVEAKPVTILWGSQTGNAEGLAKQAAKKLKKSGFAPTVADMGAYDKAKLPDEGTVLIMTSTYGEGDPPDNAADIYSWLLSEDAPSMTNLKYSVLALGDTNYPDFCKCGIDIDERLKALGATQIAPRVDCDVDFEESFEKWIGSVGEAAGGSIDEGNEAEPVEAEAPSYSKKNPFPAKLLVSRNLNGESSSKETQHLEISLKGSGLNYEAGDALGVYPQNSDSYVSDFLKVLGFSGEESISVDGESLSLKAALLETYDITGLSLKTVKAYAALVGSEEVLALAGNRAAFKEYAWGRQLIDLVADFPFKFESADKLVEFLPSMAPRLYSISSSPNAHEDEVHLTVGVVKYESHGREREGICSNYFASHDGEAPVNVFFHHSKTFKLPENNDLPVIMVGPGTGIAPFRAFLEERKSRAAGGKNWLFFGDQHASSDFLYQEELESYFREGFLTRMDTAFSRDQKEKIYVQNRMIEHGEELWKWLDEGGFFYVCGDASRMAKDVDAALHKVIETHGGKSESQAVDYVKAMKKEKRYLRDVY